MGKSSPVPGALPPPPSLPPKGYTKPGLGSLANPEARPRRSSSSRFVIPSSTGVSTEPRLGTILGRYELLAVVASGGMGRVWAARATGQHGFSRFFAVKTILPSLVHNEELRARFFDEATLAAKIHHPNVCQILDLGDEGGHPWMVLEWIDGSPLSELYVNDPTPIDPRASARIMSLVCAGLHAAHEVRGDDGEPLGAVHRDVSPQNIMVGEGIVKVTDFGIAKAIGRSLETQAGQVRGKAPYLAPEQLTAQPVDRRTDVYAAGALLYELCTGRRAYDGETDAIILMKVMNEVPQNPEELVPALPVQLRAIVARAMAKRPSDRYPTAQAMQRALDEWLAHASPLSDSALARIIIDRLGPAIQGRREQIKRKVAERASLPALPVAPVIAQKAPQAFAPLPSADPARSDRIDLQLDDILEPTSATLGALPTAAVEVRGGLGGLGGLGDGPLDMWQLDSLAPPVLPTRPSNKLPPPVDKSVPTPTPTPSPAPLELQRSSAEKAAEKRAPPGFLDPAKLAAARGAGARPPGAIPHANIHVTVPTPDPTVGKQNRPDLMAEALAVQREYERNAASRAGVDLEPQDDAPKRRSPIVLVLVAFVILAALVIGIVLAAPIYARQRVMRAANEAGLSLVMGQLDVSTGGLVLHDVTVTSAMLGGMELRGATVEMTPLFQPTALDVTGGAVTANGSFDVLRAKLRAFRDAAPAVAREKVTFDGLQLTWTGAFPDDTVIHAQSMRAEADAGGEGLALHTGSLKAEGAHGTFGPWGFDLQTTNDASTVRLLLDPSAPQGATITVVLPLAEGSPMQLSAKLARASLSHLGITPSIFGLEPDPATQIEMVAQVIGGNSPSAAHLKADLHFVLHDARPLGTTTPFDILFTAKADGGATGPVPLQISQLLIGPLPAQAEAVISFQDGLRIDGTWQVNMTCEKLAKAAGQDTFGLGASQTPLGKLLGGAKLEGKVAVQGLFTFDTRALARTRFAPTYASTCGVSLLSKAASP